MTKSRGGRALYESRATRKIWSVTLCDMPPDGIQALEDALMEKRLSPAEDAKLLREYIARAALTQSECALRLGRSQSAVANRLRLLRLPEELLRELEEAGLSERHARALLRLPGEAEQRAALAAFRQKRMSVAEAESYVEKQLSTERGKRMSESLIPLRNELDTLRRRGLCGDIELREENGENMFLLHVPK